MGVLSQWKQALRTALVAAIAMLAYQAAHLSHGYWVISAVIVMQANLGRSIRASTSRLLGTAVVATVGAAVLWVAGAHLLTVFIAVAIWICSVPFLRESQRLAAVTAVIVIVVLEGSPWHAGVNRFLM